MKQVFIRAFVIIGSALLLFACSKANADLNQGTNNPSKSGKAITISATLTDALTKVSFTPEGSSAPKMALAWESDDKLRVANHDDHNSYSDFDLVDGATTKVGVFRGEPVSASSYDIWVLHKGSEFNSGATQTQASEGDTRHIQYVAHANNVTNLNAVVFSDISSVLGLKAKLPSGAATTITSVELIASNNIFFSGNTLTINLTNASGAADDVLNLYATLPSGNKAIPDGTTLLVKFNSSNDAHTVYTRYVEFPDGKSFASGCLNHLQINCVNTDKYAGKDDDGTSAHPYLIGDKYQMDKVHDLLESNKITYFKLIDDINMAGISWVGLNNTASGGKFSKYINFDGNNKTISYITADVSKDYPSVFGVLQGCVKDLTIDHFSATSIGAKKSGAFAGYIGTGTDYTGDKIIDNVHVTNSTITGGTNYCGGFAGQLNQAGYHITNCTVEDTNISSIGYAAGFITYLGKAATISDITVKGTNVTSTGYANDKDVPTDGFAGGIAAYVGAAVDFDRCYYQKNTTTNKTATLTGSKNDNSDNGKKSRYVGGIAAYVGNVAATFDDCHVNTITLALEAAGSDNNGRYMGGAFGYIGSAVVVGNTTGCTVEGVAGNLSTTFIRNYVGGFIGYNDGGTIKNSSAAGTITGRGGCGGFVAYSKGGSFLDNTTSVELTGVGNLGGFVGITETTAPSFTRCSASGNVTASGSYSGGFAGNSGKGSYTSCFASGTLESSNTYGGGFAGLITDGTLTKCSALGDVTLTNSKNFAGGFVAGVNGAVEITKSYAIGNVSGNSTVSAFVGYVQAGANLTIQNSYSTGNCSGNVRRRGGLIAWVEAGEVTIENCYASGTLDGVYEMGGLIGMISVQTVSMSNSAAWNSRITPTQYASNNWSTGAVVGITFPTCTLTDNYRNPNMALTAYWVPEADYQHPNVSSSTPLVKQNGDVSTATSPTNGQDGYPQFPYHGKVEAGKTLSELAQSTLGWDSTVWDFSNELPTLLP